MKPFRTFHLLKILETWTLSSSPLDRFLSSYFRTHKAVGSKDRAEICHILYDLIRWKGLLDAHASKQASWKKRLDLYLNGCKKWDASAYPPHVQVSFPKCFFDRLKKAYGEPRAIELCLNSNQEAPTTIRVNLLKTTRAALLKKWEGTYGVYPCAQSKTGIVFEKRINFFALDEFKEGLFEMQDEGSQLIGAHVKASARDHVLDFCAGSGGKTLAFAPNMGGLGQIYLYDIRAQALIEAKKRLKRAGIQNAQILTLSKLRKKGLAKRMDWVLLDVPCSGSGTLRRNPDLKWRWSDASLEALTQTQRAIFEEGLKFVKKNGKIVYATCSLLPEENEEQVAYFIEAHGLKLVSPPFQSFPKKGEMDGFYCAVLSKIGEARLDSK